MFNQLHLPSKSCRAYRTHAFCSGEVNSPLVYSQGLIRFKSLVTFVNFAYVFFVQISLVAITCMITNIVKIVDK